MEDKRKLIAVDILNFSDKLRFNDVYWNLTYCDIAVKRFVEVSNAAGYEIVIFIDAGIESNEAIAKWRTRREREIISECRDVPVCLSVIVGELFRNCGVKVLYSPTGCDNDDFIAKYAQVHGADILSGDIDMARYIGRSYKIYGNFVIRDGKLILYEKKIDTTRLPTLREFIPVLPTESPKYPSFVDVIVTREYRRGVPSSLSKYTSNIHGRLGNLRRGVYQKFGFTADVLEFFPEWDSETKSVKWVQTTNTPAREDDEDLFSEDPSHYFKEIIADLSKLDVEVRDGIIQDSEIANYKMAVAFLICELYAVMRNSSFLDTFFSCPEFKELNDKAVAKLDELEIKEVPAVCRNWNAKGECSFRSRCLAASGHLVCYCRRGINCKYYHVKDSESK